MEREGGLGEVGEEGGRVRRGQEAGGVPVCILVRGESGGSNVREGRYTWCVGKLLVWEKGRGEERQGGGRGGGDLVTELLIQQLLYGCHCVSMVEVQDLSKNCLQNTRYGSTKHHIK